MYSRRRTMLPVHIRVHTNSIRVSLLVIISIRTMLQLTMKRLRCCSAVVMSTTDIASHNH